MSQLWVDEEKVPNLETALENVEKELSKQLTNIQKAFAEIDAGQATKNVNFVGKRLTLNLIDHETNNTIDLPEVEFLSAPYLNDFRYIEYADWRKQLKQTANYHEVKLEESSKIVQFLAMKFCPQVK